MPLNKGEVFAGFVIERFVGAGAMGEVYLARHPRLPRFDALKVLPSALTANEEYRFRFNREADLASTLWHPHIVGIHDRGEFNGQLWISMDYVDGTDAERLVEESYPTGMPVPEVLEIVTAIADALDTAHQRGLLHRDVKPANILLARAQKGRRRIMLADFGIARQADEISRFTGTNMTVGSVGYAAPEQLMGKRIDGRADQYGLAATAFHLLTGTLPFRDSNPTVVISKQLATPAPLLSERRPELANLDRILSVALGKDADQRYPLCLDLAEALGRANDRPYARKSVSPATRPMSAQSDASPRKLPTNPTRSLSVPPRSTAPPETPHRPSVPPPAPTAGHRRPSDSDVVRPGVFERVQRAQRDVPPDQTEALSKPTADETEALKHPAAEETEALKRSAPSAPATDQAADPTLALSRASPSVKSSISGRRATNGAAPGRAPAKSQGDSPYRAARRVMVAMVALTAAIIGAAVAYWNLGREHATPPPVNKQVAIRTKSGKTTCLLSTQTVSCEANFVHSPIKQGGLSEVTTTSAGDLQWSAATIGTPPGLVNLEYQSYHWLGWTVSAASDGTRFVNDTTGHGMFVSIEKVERI